MRIVAIGGGEIGRPGTKVETTKIDKEIIKLTGKKHLKLLFLSTASNDSESYFEVVKKHFEKRLKCKVDVLYLTKNSGNVENKILSSDIIYVGGGNTLKMMKIWRKLKIDKILRKAGEKDIVLSGVSAGSMCWFKAGLSDSRKMNNPKAPYIKVNCLGFIPFLHCPHYAEKGRKPGLKKLMKKTSGKALALDNCAAMEIIDNKFRIISSKKNACGYFVYYSKGKFFHEKIGKDKWFDLIGKDM